MKHPRTLALAALALVSVTMLPAGQAAATRPIDDGNHCTGTRVTPPKPSGQDWDRGQDITLMNCTGSVKFANVVCHPAPSFEDDNVCWSYRIPAHSYQLVTVPSNRQVHRVDWY